MYKVFFNDSTIRVEPEMKKSLNDQQDLQALFVDCRSVNQLINRIENAPGPLNFRVDGDNCFQIWNQFRTCFTEIPAAGGLVKNANEAILFIRRLGRWDLPKGKIERGETPEQAAIREVEEECGISGLRAIKPLDSTFHIYRSPFLPTEKNLVLKETHWFLMEYAGDQKPVPQTEEDIVEIQWFDLTNIDQVYPNTYASLRDFLDKSLPVI